MIWLWYKVGVMGVDIKGKTLMDLQTMVTQQSSNFVNEVFNVSGRSDKMNETLARAESDFSVISDVMFHLTPAYIFVNWLSGNFNKTRTNENHFKGIKYINSQVKMADSLKMYEITKDDIKPKTLVEYSEVHNGLPDPNDLELIHNISSSDVNILASTHFQSLENIGAVIEETTLEKLFVVALSIGTIFMEILFKFFMYNDILSDSHPFCQNFKLIKNSYSLRN